MWFGLEVLGSERYNGRLLKKLVRQAVECQGVWMKNMAKCIGHFE